MNKTPQQLHRPVLLKAVLDVLQPKKGEKYLDLTAGYGGHATAVIQEIGAAGLATLVDRDDMAIAALQKLRAAGAHILKSDFASAAEQLHASGEQFDLILIDLGVSSPQLDNAERGFSFMQEGPLDMRMDPTTGFSAADLVNKASVDELIRILREYGEEPKAPKIAQAIVRARPLKTTAQLADVVAKTHRGGWQKTHPATRTFQALRIAVNDELQQVNRTLPLLPELLKPGGRVAVISFHSLEDRLVKRYFKEQAEAGYEATLQLITKQPISGATDDVYNPRARSAKLRAAVKINK
ncbi:MAG: 16S rRNA (cytosine(1402)-N(4))-methyltransferase RsmH [Candidatus Saccharimonadales bacterium]